MKNSGTAEKRADAVVNFLNSLTAEERERVVFPVEDERDLGTLVRVKTTESEDIDSHG